MPLTAHQIRLLAPFFTDTQLIESFGATTEQISAVFTGNRPVPDLKHILPILEQLAKTAEEFRELVDTYSNPFNEKLVEKLMIRVDELDISVRLYQGLQNARIEYVWQVAIKSEKELLKTRGVGRKTLNELSEYLTELGLGLNMSPHDPHVLVALRLTERR